MKHDITQMSKILSRAQPNIQLKEVMKSSANHSAKHSDEREKSKPHYEATTEAKNPNHGQTAYKRQALPILSLNSLQTLKPTE